MEAAASLRAPAVLRLWQAILVVGLALLGLHYLGHVSAGGPRLYETWFYEGLELLAALGCLARAVFVRAERSAWFFIGAALLATTCGDVLYDFWYGGNPPYPSAADVGYLAFYPLIYVGIVLLLRRRVSTFSPSLWLDGLMAATAVGALGSAVLVKVIVSSTHGDPLVVVTNLAYPLGDLLLLALIVFVFSVTRWQPGRAWTLIAAGLLLNAVGDAVYLYQTAVGTLRRGHLPRPRLAALARPRRARRLATARSRVARRASRTRAARHAVRVRPDRDGSPRRGIPGARSPHRAHPRLHDDRARPRPYDSELLGEHAVARGQPAPRRSRTR